MANNDLNQLPNLIKNPKSSLNAFSQAIKNGLLEEAQDYASSNGFSTKRMPTYLVVTEQRMAKKGVIDLKQSFSRSSRRKLDKKGNWYLIIPIAVKRRAISRRAYNDIKTTPTMENAFTNTATDYLYDKAPKFSTEGPIVNATPKTFNVAVKRQKWGTSFRRNYIAFRTVSAKSPVNSWIINRQKVNSDEFSPTMIKNIERLMKFRMRNL